MNLTKNTLSRKEVFLKHLDDIQVMLQASIWVAGLFAGFVAGLVVGAGLALPGLMWVGCMRLLGYRVSLYWEVSR